MFNNTIKGILFNEPYISEEKFKNILNNNIQISIDHFLSICPKKIVFLYTKCLKDLENELKIKSKTFIKENDGNIMRNIIAYTGSGAAGVVGGAGVGSIVSGLATSATTAATTATTATTVVTGVATSTAVVASATALSAVGICFAALYIGKKVYMSFKIDKEKKYKLQFKLKIS